MPLTARDLWQLIEPYHAVTYFAPECHEAYERVGLRGFWRGYFAGRAAPLGAVGAGVVTGTFYGFQPDFVARALPSVWTMTSPEQARDARLAGIDRALHPIFGDELHSSTFAEAAELARRAAEGCQVSGRPLYAANADLAWPSEPHLVLWHAATLMREHRGDGHVAALVIADIDPCEAHITQIAASGAPVESIKPYRGWTDDDWSAATERLLSRGLLATDGGLTSKGEQVRAQIEDDTDRLAEEPVARLGFEGATRLRDLLRPIVRTLIGTETIPYPNPIGVPAPEGLEAEGDG